VTGHSTAGGIRAGGVPALCEPDLGEEFQEKGALTLGRWPMWLHSGVCDAGARGGSAVAPGEWNR
jgi:hypothetical protein